MSETTFIYALCDPTTGEVRYIGKADNPKRRMICHSWDARRGLKTHKARWISSLRASERVPAVEILQEVSSSGWQDAERYWIKLARMAGVRLTNTTPGGDGLGSGKDNPSFGRRGPLSASFGKRLSDEHKANLKAAHTHSMRGRKHSLETRAKMSAGCMGRRVPDEAREKIRKTLTGRKIPQHVLVKMIASKTGKKLTDKHRDSLSFARAGRKTKGGGSSRYVGVTWAKKRGAWAANIRIGDHLFWLGDHISEVDAAITYDWVSALFGRPTNFQNDPTCTLAAQARI